MDGRTDRRRTAIWSTHSIDVSHSRLRESRGRLWIEKPRNLFRQSICLTSCVCVRERERGYEGGRGAAVAEAAAAQTDQIMDSRGRRSRRSLLSFFLSFSLCFVVCLAIRALFIAFFTSSLGRRRKARRERERDETIQTERRPL